MNSSIKTNALRSALALVGILGGGALGRANTLYVAINGSDSNPGTAARPYQSLKQGLFIAKSGDTVLVGPGTYSGPNNSELNFAGKNITVKSIQGAASTIIDGSWQGRPTFVFQHDYTRAATLDGFTIRNANTNGSVWGSGGAILMNAGSPTLRNLVFKSCGTTTSGGGAVTIGSGSPLLWGCTFEGNHAGDGGAIASNYGTALLSHCTFQGNSAINGGAISAWGAGSLQIDQCAFRQNHADSQGGAMLASLPANVSGSTFLGNDAGAVGGAVCTTAKATFAAKDSAFVGNSCGVFGGAIYDLCGSTFEQCTLTGNYAEKQGGALFVTEPIGPSGSIPTGQLRIANSILYGNTQGGGNYYGYLGSPNPGPNQVWVFKSYAFSDSVVQGGVPGTNILDVDPMFVRAPGAPGYPYGDLHLQPGSPCLDRGASLNLQNYESDLDGLGRVVNGKPDLGAYEMQPTSWFQNSPNVHYVLYNASSLQALQGGPNESDRVFQTIPNGALNQQWDVVPLGSGNYRLVNRASGRDLDVLWLSQTDGSPVATCSWNGGNNQQWTLSFLGNGTYKIGNVNSGKLLEAAGANTASGTPVDQWTDLGGANRHEQWILVQVKG